MDCHLHYFLVALGGAVISTLPIGPINLVLVTLALDHKRAVWLAMTGGVIVADVLASVAAFAGTRALASSPVMHDELVALQSSPWTSVILVLVLTALGGHLMMARQNSAQSVSAKTLKRGRFALLLAAFAGVAATLAEPGLIVFWGAWWLRFGVDPKVGMGTAISLFALGIVIGDLAVFGSYLILARKLRRYLTGRLIDKLRFASGAFLIVCAAFLGLVTLYRL